MQKIIELKEKCPWCSEDFKLKLDVFIKPDGLTHVLVKPHEKCDQFVLILGTCGTFRGTILLDKKDRQISDNISIILKEHQDLVLFYYIQHSSYKENMKGILVSSNAKYNEIARGSFFMKWVENCEDNEKGFTFMVTEEGVLVTIKLEQDKRLTVGLSLEKMNDKNIPTSSVNELMKSLKEFSYSLGKKVFGI